MNYVRNPDYDAYRAFYEALPRPEEFNDPNMLLIYEWRQGKPYYAQLRNDVIAWCQQNPPHSPMTAKEKLAYLDHAYDSVCERLWWRTFARWSLITAGILFLLWLCNH